MKYRFDNKLCNEASDSFYMIGNNKLWKDYSFFVPSKRRKLHADFYKFSTKIIFETEAYSKHYWKTKGNFF